MSIEVGSEEAAVDLGEPISSGDSIHLAFGFLQARLSLNMVACVPASSGVDGFQAATPMPLGKSSTEVGGEAYERLLPKLAGLAESAPAMSGEDYGRWVDSLPFGEFVEWLGIAESNERLESALGDALVTSTAKHRQDLPRS